MLIEIELVVDLPDSLAGKPLLEKYNVEDHGLDFYQGVIVNGGRLIYLAGQVANNPDGAVAGVGDWRPQAEDFPAVAEIRSSIFPGELPASTLIVVNRLAQPDLLIEVEGMAALG